MFDRLFSSYRVRLAASMALLAGTVSFGGVAFYYLSMRNFLVSQARSQLLDVARTSTYLFDQEHRLILKRLVREVRSSSSSLDAAAAGRIAPGQDAPGMSPQEVRRIEAGADFQAIVQKLRQIKEGSRSRVQPLALLPPGAGNPSDPPLVRYAYLLVSTTGSPDRRVLQFVADADYEDIDLNRDGQIEGEEQGNSPGTYYGVERFFSQAFYGRATASPDWYTDRWGTWLTAVVPIMDTNQEILALLALDYSIKEIDAQLHRLLFFSCGIVFISILFSMLIAHFLSKYLARPIKELRIAAERVQRRDFRARVYVSTGDDVEILANQFNRMVEEIEHYSADLEQMVRERTRELVEQKMKLDDLLVNILPYSAALQLKESGRVRPIEYDSVTVMFTDFRDFSRIAHGMSPEILIDELDRCFSDFDDMIERHGLEKLKTIGDSYMCAGGLPVKNRTHPVDVVLAALLIRDFMIQMNESRRDLGITAWDMRIGIHTGPVIAGVIGKKKFAYDVWGDAVNTASRMESAGEVDQVNISEAAYNLVKDFFVAEFRGSIAVKNMGEIRMYFVRAIRPELSKGGAGITPNEDFFELYNRMKG